MPTSRHAGCGDHRWSYRCTTTQSPASQGMRNHDKTDRLLDVVRRKRIPLVLFAGGRRGRPAIPMLTGHSDWGSTSFAHSPGCGAWCPPSLWSHRCFAGNAALAGALT